MTKKKNIRVVSSAGLTEKLSPPTQKNSFLLFLENKTNQLWITGLLTILLSVNTLWNQFALDDMMVLGENKFVNKGISGIPDILSHDSFYGSIGNVDNLAGGRYRPLSLIAYAIEISLFGKNAMVHHLFNVLFYVLTALTFLLLLRKFIFPGYALATLVATLLFIIHPIHTEVAANIKSRDEIFSLLFLLLALYYLLSFANGSGRKTHFALSILLYFLALFSKENGLTFLAIIPITLYFFSGKKAKEVFTLSLPYFFVAACYVLIRIALIGFKNSDTSEVMDNPYLLASLSEKYATIFFVLMKYLQLLIWPHPLTYDYSYKQIPYHDFGSVTVWLSLLIHLCMAAYAILTFKRKDILSWCILFYLASIFIISNIVVNIGAPMAERFLFQASVAFVIFVTELGKRIFQRLSVPQSAKIYTGSALLFVVIGAGAYATIDRNKDWKSDEVLFLHDVKISSRSARANTYAGVALVRLCDQSKDKEERRDYALKALEYFRISSSIDPEYITTLLNMGVAFSRLDSLSKAEALWNRARERYPNDRNLKLYDQYMAQTYYRLGLNEGAGKNYPLSIQYLEKSVRYDPSNADAWYNLGGAYFTVHDYEKAKKCWEKTLELDIGHVQAQQGLKAIGEVGRER